MKGGEGWRKQCAFQVQTAELEKSHAHARRYDLAMTTKQCAKAHARCRVLRSLAISVPGLYYDRGSIRASES